MQSWVFCEELVIGGCCFWYEGEYQYITMFQEFLNQKEGKWYDVELKWFKSNKIWLEDHTCRALVHGDCYVTIIVDLHTTPGYCRVRIFSHHMTRPLTLLRMRIGKGACTAALLAYINRTLFAQGQSRNKPYLLFAKTCFLHYHSLWKKWIFCNDHRAS